MLDAVLSALIAIHQPTVMLGHSRVAVDTGGDTLVSKRASALAPGRRLTVLGRTDRALTAPDSYLAHWYLTNAIAASVGPTWIAKGPVTFDFATNTVSLSSATQNSVPIPMQVAQDTPFFNIGIAGATYTCLFDTGAVGQSKTGLEAVNALDARTFDALVRAHPMWRLPGTITIAADKGTNAAAWLRVPMVNVGSLHFAAVRFVRREPRTFLGLTKLLARDVQCDAGGALFDGKVVTLDLRKRLLDIR